MTDIIQVADEYYVRASSALADDRTRVLKYGDTFAVFNRYGDIEASVLRNSDYSTPKADIFPASRCDSISKGLCS